MKNIIKNEAEYESYRKVVLNMFSPEFTDKFRSNATAHKVVEAMTRGVSAYEIIEQLIEAQEDQFKIVQRAISNSTNPFGV